MSQTAAGLSFGTHRALHTTMRPHPLSRLAIGLIDLYRRHLSPRKGYACPHRLLHGGDSCSAAIRTLYQTQGPLAATRDAFGRLRECSAVSDVLARTDSDAPDAPGHLRRHRGQCCIVLPLPTCGGTRTYRAP